jgi:hypothetical protein
MVPLFAVDSHPFVTCTQYCVVEVRAPVVNVAEPLPTGFAVVPVTPWYHWNVSGAVPAAEAVSVALHSGTIS